MSETWHDRMPRSVIDPFGPRDEPIWTPVDRRMLWHLEGSLAVLATNDRLRQVARDLRSYLNATCEHHWTEYEAEKDIAAHRQCLWCSDVEWLGGSTEEETPDGR